MNTKKELDPLNKHLDAILRASGTTLANFETSAGALQGMRAALLAAVADLAPASAAPANHFPDAAKMVAKMSDEQIKTILLTAGYTIKPGSEDLKPYVYAGARALLSAAPQPPAQPAGDAAMPEPVAHVSKGDHAFFTKWTTTGAPLRGGIALFTADQMRAYAQAALAAKDAEIARLTKCLQEANSQTEEFERKWYLRGDELERMTAERDAAWLVVTMAAAKIGKDMQ